MEVSSTKKNPRVIAAHYFITVRQLKGVPRGMRCDKGTENTIIGTLQQFFRWHDFDDFAEGGSFIQGKSSGNQRIEARGLNFARAVGDGG